MRFTTPAPVRTRSVLAIAILVIATASATAADSKWIVKQDDAFGCMNEQTVRQLQTMAVLRSAFEIALAQEIDAGKCQMLKTGELLTRLSESNAQSGAIYRMQRADAKILYIEARFLAQSI